MNNQESGRQVRLWALAGASLAAFGAATTVHAADASASISEVVVVGEKHATTLQKAPLAISAVGADTLTSQNITSVVGLNGYVPGLTIAENAGRGTVIAIRGVGYDSDNISTSPGVSLHVDGVYIVATFAGGTSFLDTERVEVLRGPQGTVFGQSSAGGAVNLISYKPKIGVFSGDAAVSYGNYNLVKVDGAVNIPISDTFALRGSIDATRHDGFAKQLYVPGQPNYRLDDANNIGGKLSLLWQPISSVSAIFSGQQYYSDTHGPALKDVYDPNPNPRMISQDLPNNVLSTYNLATADVKWTSPYAIFESVSAYQRGIYNGVTDNDRLAYVVKPYYDDLYSDNVSTSVSQELTVSSLPGGPVDWTAGIFYLNERYADYVYEFEGTDAHPTITFPTTKFNLPYNFNYSVFTSYVRQSYAGFGQATVKVTPTVSVTAGVRYTQEYLNSVTNTDLLEYSPLTKTSVSASEPTGKLEADWDWAPKNMVYASLSRGFKPGGVNLNNSNILAPHTFLPETISALEVGSKNRFMDNRLTLNLALFYYEDQNYQYQEEDPIPYQGGVSNVPEAHIYGAEAEGSFKVTDDIVLSGNLTKLAGNFTGAYKALDPSLAAGIRAGKNPYSGAVIGALFGAAANTKGNTVPNMPDWQGSFSLDDTARIGPGTLNSRVTVVYRGTFVDRVFNTAVIDKVPSYDTVNLNFEYKPDHSAWSVGLTATNLFDADGIVNRYSNPFGSFTTDQQYIPPRQVFGTVKYAF